MRALLLASGLMASLALGARAGAQGLALPPAFVPRLAGAHTGPAELVAAISLDSTSAQPTTIETDGGSIMRAAGWRQFRIDHNDWLAPVASAILPGSGQALLHRSRALPYLVVEAFGWAQYVHELRQGRRRREDYRGLARVVARAPYSDSLPVGNWEYYESMEKFAESGVYNANPIGGFAPETDPATFNGSVWLLARRTFWENVAAAPPPGSPEYQRAEEFYLRRAVRPEYRWSWKSALLEQDVFRSAIHESNAAFRLASQYLSVVLANHALSAVDAFVTLRLQGTPDGHQYGVTGSIPWAPFGWSRRD